MSRSESGTPGVFASLRGFAATSVALLRTRLELLKVETQEEVARIASLLVWSVAAVLLGLAGLIFLAVFLTVLLWDTHRVLVLGMFAALFVASAFTAGIVAMKLARQGSRLFAASLAELRRDATALDGNPQP